MIDFSAESVMITIYETVMKLEYKYVLIKSTEYPIWIYQVNCLFFVMVSMIDSSAESVMITIYETVRNLSKKLSRSYCRKFSSYYMLETVLLQCGKLFG